ncbi:hypothetical protein OAS39_04710 [Pirellulales bacterium]|nr:hypothetical protein [Pirellulales bacterium]
MAITKDDLQSFQSFADEMLTTGTAESLQEILDKWNTRREHQQSVAGIKESISQYEAGEGLPVDQAFNEIRSKLGWSK